MSRWLRSAAVVLALALYFGFTYGFFMVAQRFGFRMARSPLESTVVTSFIASVVAGTQALRSRLARSPGRAGSAFMSRQTWMADHPLLTGAGVTLLVFVVLAGGTLLGTAATGGQRPQGGAFGAFACISVAIGLLGVIFRRQRAGDN